MPLRADAGAAAAAVVGLARNSTLIASCCAVTHAACYVEAVEGALNQDVCNGRARSRSARGPLTVFRRMGADFVTVLSAPKAAGSLSR